MMLRKRLGLFIAVIFLFFTGFASAVASGQKDFFRLLTTDLGVSEKSLSNINKRIIVEEIPVRNNPREIALVAIMRIGVPKAFLMKQLYGHGSILFSKNSSRSGIFGNPPRPRDMFGFQFPKSDLEVMRGCEIGDCKIKLPGHIIEALEKLDWSSKDSADKINKLFRNDIAAYTENYMAQGRYGLITYADKIEPQPLIYGFERILTQSSYLNKYAPKLYRYLINFPEDTLEGVESYIYWSVAEFGLRPVTEITHVTVYHPPTVKATLIAEKQIYASHYFWARFKVSVVIDNNEDADIPGVFLICLDHSLFDDNLSKMKRRFLSLSVRKKFRSKFSAIRSRLEKAFRFL